MAEELSPLDYLLHRGEAYPATRSAFLNLEILDGAADWGRLREAMDRASRVVIRMRQKVVIPPLPATPPRLVVDPDFDLDYHLRRVALPAPGTLRQLLDFAELTLQSPLDTSRALWEAVYVEGLADGRSALLTKLSHAITDGLGGIALFEQVYDTERDPEPRPMPPVPVPRDVSGSDLLRDSIRQLPETTFTAGRKLLGRAAGTAARAVTAAAPPEPDQPNGRARAAPRRLARGGQGCGRVGERRVPGCAVRWAWPVPRGARRAGRRAPAGPAGQPARRGRPGLGQPVRRGDHRGAGRRVRSGRADAAGPPAGDRGAERTRHRRDRPAGAGAVPAPRRGAARGRRPEHPAGHPGQQRAGLRPGDLPGRGAGGPAVRARAAAAGGHDGDPHLPRGHLHRGVPLRHRVVRRNGPAGEVPSGRVRRDR